MPQSNTVYQPRVTRRQEDNKSKAANRNDKKKKGTEYCTTWFKEGYLSFPSHSENCHLLSLSSGDYTHTNCLDP